MYEACTKIYTLHYLYSMIHIRFEREGATTARGGRSPGSGGRGEAGAVFRDHGVSLAAGRLPSAPLNPLMDRQGVSRG
jgi:hypothetical protein